MGGAERWIWFLLLLDQLFPSDKSTQYFHDQLWEFIKDHNIDDTMIGMTRV